MAVPSPPYAVEDLLAYLAGRWSVVRVIEDRSAGVVGGFEGTLDCTPDADAATLTMHEHGELDWSGVRRPAFRTTRLAVGDQPGVAEVRFDDGRLFHTLDLRSGVWVADHPCAPDAYEGTFTVNGRDAWAYEWRVTGPRKDLLLRSRVTRERPPSR
ncbi:MAG: DUF6314 family protein [Nocardioidaceae bacterium]